MVRCTIAPDEYLVLGCPILYSHYLNTAMQCPHGFAESPCDPLKRLL
jgi:hypothetical protein